MTSVWEETGYSAPAPKFKPRPAQARFEGVRDLGRDAFPKQWEALVTRADGKQTAVYDVDKDKAIGRARSLAAALNGSAK